MWPPSSPYSIMQWGGESTDRSSFKSTFSYCVSFPQLRQRRYNFHQKRVSQKKVWLSSFSDQIHSGLESKIDDETKDWSTPLIITIWLSSINTAVTYWRLNTFSFTVNLNSHTNMKNVSCVISSPTCRVKLFSSLNGCEGISLLQSNTNINLETRVGGSLVLNKDNSVHWETGDEEWEGLFYIYRSNLSNHNIHSPHCTLKLDADIPKNQALENRK